MSSPAKADILVVVAKTSQEQSLVDPLKNDFGRIRVLSRPTAELLRQTLAECKPKLLICDLESHTLAVRNIRTLIEGLGLSTNVIAAGPAVSSRAVIRAMGQGARDLVSPEDPLHLQLVVARELGILPAWCERNAHRLAPFVEEDEGHATLDGFRILGCDTVLAAMVGIPAKALQKTSLLQYVDGDDHHAVKQLINRCIQGENVSTPVPVRLVKADGTRQRMLIAVKAAYKDDSVSLMLTVQRELDTAATGAAAVVAAPAQLDQAVTRRVLNALKQNQMSLVVQPISELVGQPDRKPSSKLDIYVMIKDAEGELPASRFIGEARASGLIRYVDRWVIQNACKILRANLQKEGPMLLFLRLSRQSLHDATLVPALGHEARDKGIPPECLSFELIQSDTVDLTGDEIQALRQIKEAGFLLTVSGLGSNPASQSLLQQLPVDFIKLDPKLTEKAEQSDNARKLIQEFVEAANARNTGVISTQVPNATVMAALWNLGVHYVQGNYLQEPEIVLQA